MDNAIRYSPTGSAIEVSASFNRAAQRCLLSVADCGPGLSQKQASQIGTRFWRGDQGRQSKDGAGLGISIVHAIAERFGGSLSLTPRKGGGLVAEIMIPLN